ncbi:hypothetical protein B0H21DRAFT_684345 [Amylocystis lapponica]|nr:hypothetical protein B0H21DRAFT_684345 [Amylocystis lapponica]
MVKNIHQLTPEDTSGPLFMRKKSEEEDSNRVSKKPRTRVSYSCGECHRRKQKCDRQVPCSHCIARKVPELCKAYTPGKTDQDIHVRLARLEHIIETALPQYCSHGHSSTPFSDGGGGYDRRRSLSPGADDGNRSQPEEEDPNGGMFESGRWYGKSASGSIAAPVVLEQLQHMVVPNGRSEPMSPGSAATQLQADLFRNETRLLAAPEPSAADKLKLLIRDYGFHPNKVSELVNELPARNLSQLLVDHYFGVINWTRYPISERDFRASFNCICEEGTTVNPNNIRFLPLLFVVLAISARLAPERIGGDERTRRLSSSRLYWSSRRALLIVAAIQPDCFEMVLTRMLSARFLTIDRRMTESWSQLGAAVRTAQALGLHRDGAAMGMDMISVEKRRRIWAHLYHADRSIALVLGRPISIQDAYSSTLPPSNLETVASADHHPFPLTTPTRATFMILRNTLAGIMGRMSHHFQSVRGASHYSDVVELDDELLKFMQNLPPHYAMDPNTSLDQSHPYIPLHRFLLVTEVLFVRITLNRPYLLRRLGSDRYLRSRQACFESALKDHQIRRAFLESTTKEARDPITSAYREFQAAMISGIYLVLYPNGKDAEAMHTVLDTFVKGHERLPEMDDTTRREIRIIQFLKSRSSQMSGKIEDSGERKMDIDALMSKKSNSDPSLLMHRPPVLQPSIRPSHLSESSFPTPSMSSVSASSSMSVLQSAFTHMSPVQQLQNEESPSGSGSPSGDDESAAQSLLDQWCNIFSGGPPVDDVTGATGLPWGTPGLTDVSGWLGPATTSPLLGSEPLPGVDGSDWSYWETLVNQIRSSPFRSTDVIAMCPRLRLFPSAFFPSLINSATSCNSHRSAGGNMKRARSSEYDGDTAPGAKKFEIVHPPSSSTGSTTKILSWNVETPVPFLDLPLRKVGSSSVIPGSHPSLLRDMLARHNFPDFVCLQEVRARHTDKEWIAAFRAAVKGQSGEPSYTPYTSLNKATRGQRHFGVLTYVKNPEHVAVAREVDWDTEGRVLILEMKSGWALLNVYALNGSEYMWRDSRGIAAPKTRNERKREFNRLLLEECRAMQARGLLLVLIGDFNISLDERDCVPRLRTEYPHGLARKEFKELFIPGLDVVDVYREMHGDRAKFSWFAKGKPQGADCARVDYALVVRKLWDRVVETTYLDDPVERAHSDHAPLILTLRDMFDLGKSDTGP